MSYCIGTFPAASCSIPPAPAEVYAAETSEKTGTARISGHSGTCIACGTAAGRLAVEKR